MRRDHRIRLALCLTCLALAGIPRVSAYRSEEARIASEISASRTLAAENASLSRSALQREFDRVDRNLAAANEWMSAQQSADSRAMNDGVSDYLKMVHENEAAVRRSTEEYHRKVQAEMEAFQKQWAESMRRSREADERFAARMREIEAETRAQLQAAEQKEIIQALGFGAPVGERLALLRKLVSQQATYWDQRAAAALGPAVTSRTLFHRLLVRTLDQTMSPDGTLALSDDQRVDLYFVLRRSDLQPLVPTLSPDHYCALLIAVPWAFAAHDGEGILTANLFADLVASLRHLADLKAGGAVPAADKAADSILSYVNDGKSKPRNVGEALELAHLLRDVFKRTDDALRFLDLNPLGVYNHAANADTDRYAAFLFETLMENRDRLVASNDNFFGSTGAGYVTNCLALQARIARELAPGRIVHSAPLTAIPRLQAMLRQFRNRDGYSSAWRKRLGAQRSEPERYAKTVADCIESITRAVDDGALLERNGLFDTIRAESRNPENPAGAIAALAVLQVMEHPPAWRKTLLPEDRSDVVTAWLWALARGDAGQRATLLARYPAILADPAKSDPAPRLDHRLFLLDADSKWPGLDATAALLDLNERCDARTGALPANPEPWVAALGSTLLSGSDAVARRWIAVLQSAAKADGENAAALRQTARQVLGRLAERDFTEHKTVHQGIAENLALLVPAGTELAPGLPVLPEYVTARMKWEAMIADDAAPLDAARAAIAGLAPGEARVLAFGLMAHDRSGRNDEPLLLSSDPNFSTMILQAVDETQPVSNTLWLRLLGKTEPACPRSTAEWAQLRTTGNW